MKAANTVKSGKKYTIGEWSDVWLETYAKHKYKPKTIESYQDSRNRMVKNCPGFGSMQLTDLLPYQFQQALNHLGSKYAFSTVSHIKSLYNKVFETAVSNHLCQWNPITDCTTPREAPIKVVTALNRKEQEKFEEALNSLPLRDQFALFALLFTGLRRGELLNLIWPNWNEEKKVLNILDSKTAAGIRHVPVIPEVEFILRSLKMMREEGDSQYIFTFHGEKMSPHHLRWICKKAAKIAGIRHVHPHMLRHTFASRMVENKADVKSLAKIIGHTDAGFTLRVYVDIDETEHLQKEMLRISKIANKAG